jgi:hypothetical protein
MNVRLRSMDSKTDQEHPRCCWPLAKRALYRPQSLSVLPTLPPHRTRLDGHDGTISQESATGWIQFGLLFDLLLVEEAYGSISKKLNR